MMSCKNFLFMNIVSMLIMLFAVSAGATTLTFDFNPALTDAYDFGRANFTTVYGDRGATGSNGTTYSYNGVDANTPNIQIDYGLILNERSVYPEKWYNNPGKALFRAAGYVLNNYLYPSGSTGNQVIMFKPDSGYGMTIHSVDVGKSTEGIWDAQVEVWESKTRADGLEGLDISTFVVGQRGLQPYLVEGVDYEVVYFENPIPYVNFKTYSPNVSSGKILWLVIGSPTNSSGGLNIDNVSFSQALPSTCEDIQKYGFTMQTDFNGDCNIDFADFTMLAQNWLLDFDPHEVVSFGNKDELLIDGKPKLPFGVYGIYTNFVGQGEPNLVGQGEWANVYFTFETSASGGNLTLQVLGEAEAVGARLLIPPYPKEIWDKVRTNTTGSHLSSTDADMIKNWINNFKLHNGLLGYLLDEPEAVSDTPVSWYEDLYQCIRNADQYGHPVVMVNCRVAGISAFQNVADVLMPDPYPSPLKSGNGGSKGGIIEYVLPFIDTAVATGKPTWITPQVFNYALFSESLEDTRAPNYDELRGMIFGAVAHGAKGCIGYSYYYYRVEPDLEIGYKYIGMELQKLKRPILQGNISTASSSNSDVHVMSKNFNGELITIAVNVSGSSKTAIIDQQQQSGTLYVLSEDRTVSPTSGSFSDTFAPYAVHVYTNKNYITNTLTTVKAEIQAAKDLVVTANATNLAYIGNGGVVSSRNYLGRLALNDGYYDTGKAAEAVYTFESDGSSSDDYIEVSLANPSTVKTVTVYSTSPRYPTQIFENYTIKVYSSSNGWQTVKQVTGNSTFHNLAAGSTDFTAIGNPTDITKVRFEGVPAGNRTINEIRILE